jgi:hypothetical protein
MYVNISMFFCSYLESKPNSLNICHNENARFQVLTTASKKMAVFSDVVPSRLVDTDRRFREAYCRYHRGNDSSRKARTVTLYIF